jgi:hypothetical protein
MSAITAMPSPQQLKPVRHRTCGSCGELNAPLARMTSALARARCVVPPWAYSTPTARRPSNRMRVVSALDTTRRLGRRRAGLR